MTIDTSNKAEKNKSLTDKETLLTWAIQMFNIANGLMNFMNNAEYLKNAKRNIQFSFLIMHYIGWIRVLCY